VNGWWELHFGLAQSVEVVLSRERHLVRIYQILTEFPKSDQYWGLHDQGVVELAVLAAPP
jgi:hypothetical protein